MADWTATNAKFQSSGTDLGPDFMVYDQDADEFVVKKWMDDPQLTHCSSPSRTRDPYDADICRYINYPLHYSVEMQPINSGTITQQNAKPEAQQGQSTLYASGFSWSIGGGVNVNGKGPGAGITGGVTWNNTTTTTSPPIKLDLSQTATGQGALWTWNYCTTGQEPDANGNCTNHVQMVKDVCSTAQLGDFSGTNPQQGQTTKGAFTDAVHTVLWQAGPDTRIGQSTFDITISAIPTIGNTTVHLWGNSIYDRGYRTGNCDWNNCNCASKTEATPLVEATYTFKIPLPSTTCSPP